MKIIYKNNNYKGAKTLLFGLKDLSILENTITLENLKNYQNKEIYLSIDKNLFNEDIKVLEKNLKQIDNYNIKGILFYDLAVLNLAKKLNIKTPLIWNQNFLVTNYKTINYYNKDNIKGTVISSEITIEEIKEIAKNTNLDLFVNLFGYQLMAVSKRSLISNYFKHINQNNNTDINCMIEKNNKYPVIENDICTKFYTKEVLNGIKYINILKEIGIKYIILEDIFLDKEIFNKVANIYEKAINNEITEEELLTKEEEINKLISNTSTLFLNKKTIYKVKRK